MKRNISNLFIILLVCTKTVSYAQQYGNEWIDHSKTYYKFRVGTEGIYRINKTTLDALGVPQSNGTQYVMYCNGVEVPIFVSTNAAFGSGDYIEFFGEKASGTPDRELFDNPSWQANINRSLFTDTASYFLTTNNASTNLRYTNAANNISSPPPAQPFCYAMSEAHYSANYFAGKHFSNEHIYFSTFDHGEGFTDASHFTNQPFSLSLNTPNVTTGANATIKLAMIRNGYNGNSEPLKVSINNQLIADSTIGMDVTKQFDLSVSSSLLTTNNSFQFSSNLSGGSAYDVYGCSFITVKYPRNFDVSSLNYFKFYLPASSGFQYIELQNFNHNGTSPKLYDLTNNKWYVGNIGTSGITKFNLEPSPSSERKLVVISQNSSQLFNISGGKQIQFTNYSTSSNQGDYVIVTQKNYQAITNGRNYVQDYHDYRESVSGGSRTAIIANVDDLYDQFAYGIETHPMAIKHFMKMAYDTWTTKPTDLFLIGKGASYEHNRTYFSNPTSYNFSGNLAPYGMPGSDVNFVNFLPNKLQAIGVGRLSAWTPQEIGSYLEKVKQYESAQATPISPDYESELWKRKVLHAAGGSDAAESANFMTMLNSNAAIISDTSYGSVISRVSKTTTGPIDNNANASLDSLINSGVSFIVYHGHASQTGFQLNTLNDPSKYISVPKFSHFLGLGCDVSYIYTLSSMKAISEQYLYVPNGGSVSFIASDNLQYAGFHASYLPHFYRSVSKVNYGKDMGTHTMFAYNNIRSVSTDDFNFFHLESMILQGDPGVKTFGPTKPDYHVAASRISSIPVNVTTDEDSFQLKIVAYNLAKAVTDTVELRVEHTNPKNQTTTVSTSKIVNLYNSDTVVVTIPVDRLADLGLNKYKVTIDAMNEFDETSESNNTATYDLFIYSDNLVPIYPQEFSIVNKQSVTLKASTLNPFRAMGRYKIEIDTTELFNSNLKQTTTITSGGGVIKWTPSITYNDSTVYYWRTAFDSVINGDYRWTTSSFIYLANGSDGWNQSHYYQYKKNSFFNLNYGADRVFKYPTGNVQLEVYCAVYSQWQWTAPWNTGDYNKVVVNGFDIQRVGCAPWDGTIQVFVFDSLTAALWVNNGGNGGASGSYNSCNVINNTKAFEFPVNTITGRNNAKHFLDSIPNNNYVLIKNQIVDTDYDPSFIDEWKLDENVNGVGQSLYHTMYNMGFTEIDSFYEARPFIFFRKKGNNNYPLTQVVAKEYDDSLIRRFSIPATISEGEMNSTVIGPAKEWKTLKWQTSSRDGLSQNDLPHVNVTGIDKNNISSLLYSGYAKDTSLNFIDATQYPNLQLKWHSLDSVNRTSPQLDFWRVLYSPVPEAALNPAAHLVFEDSLQSGQMMQFAVAIENLTDLPMDSMLVSYKVIDANNTTHTLQSVRYKPLPGNDTLHAAIQFDPSSYPGNNVFFIEANPDNDQPEQYHPNNLGYLPFNIQVDNRNPFIDVTFDGVHILDKDIVSAEPFIKIALKDENKYLKLDDTSLLTLKVRYPNEVNTFRTIPFDGSTSKFIPAQGNKNEAYIEYRPKFTEDGTYELTVNGKDKTGNVAGRSEYKISFEVINKATITNVLNYPNPFSTSTAFVFTLTGSQVPTQFKIQILTVTGKVVREVTRQELGNIHVGKNITDYKWDGKDQYGQMLGNGVYFYRIVTALNGNDIEHRSSGADKFFKNGYGKMYIMR